MTPILDPGGHPVDVALDESQIANLMAAELRVRDWRGPAIVALPAFTTLQLAGLVQLALRHPQTPETHRAAAELFLDAVRAYFVDCPTILEILRRGDDPAEDVAP